MHPVEPFVGELLDSGRIVYRERPEPVGSSDWTGATLFTAPFQTYRREVPGPPIELDLPVAFAAAELVRQAGWALVSHDRPVDWLERHLRMPAAPTSASQHLSGDFLLRFLPQIHRRARAHDPADPLIGVLERTLRQWPLSGVLAEVDEGPTTTVDFDGHEGLMLLYAERLARRDRPAWRPLGRPLEYVALVAEDLNRHPGGGVRV